MGFETQPSPSTLFRLQRVTGTSTSQCALLVPRTDPSSVLISEVEASNATVAFCLVYRVHNIGPLVI